MSLARILSSLLLALAVGGWLVVLRPVNLGGPAGYLWVSGVSMLPTLQSGDLVVTQRQDRYAIGDVLAYHVPRGQPGAGAIVIHRLVGGSPSTGYTMKGDNKNLPDEWHPRQSDVVGKLWITLPGGAKYIQVLRSPTVFAPLVAALVVVLILLGGSRPKDRRAEEAPAP